MPTNKNHGLAHLDQFNWIQTHEILTYETRKKTNENIQKL